MARLIDADALFRRVSKELGSGVMYLPIDFQEMIVDSPAVDAVPVVHGRWIDEAGNPVLWTKSVPSVPAGWCKCSVCGAWLVGSDEYPCYGYYCPACGARMDA